MKLSEIFVNGDIGVSEIWGVELDEVGLYEADFIKKISFKAVLDDDFLVSDDFLFNLSMWVSSPAGFHCETMVEIPSNAKSDVMSILYGISLIGASVVFIPPVIGSSKNEVADYMDKMSVISDLSFTKDFKKPVQPICGYLSQMMSSSYSGEACGYDHYLEAVFNGGSGKYVKCQSELINIIESSVKEHIGDPDEFHVFSKQMMEQIAVNLNNIFNEQGMVRDE